jgi:hypothetical protein
LSNFREEAVTSAVNRMLHSRGVRNKNYEINGIIPCLNYLLSYADISLLHGVQTAYGAHPVSCPMVV